MINEETRRKLREINLGEAIKGLEVQQADPATIALPFDERMQRRGGLHLPGEIQWEDTAADQVSKAPFSAGKPAGSHLCQPRIKQGAH